ncbi:8755_t:CDS:2 [Funneliformis geosporum]|uniref:8755_t:CDS:1 n=1 Tax=Funneliformis geosporum TaxID=1117311 RepID=A0A9W4SWM6_9GLOM|nr:8755_t:CDS:2 [Funneliformis geosporum]
MASLKLFYPHVRVCHQTADDAGSAKGRLSRLSFDGDLLNAILLPTLTSSTQFSYPHVRACYQTMDDAGSAKGRPSRLSSDGDLLNAILLPTRRPPSFVPVIRRQTGEDW